MIDRAHPTLSISRQCHLLEVSRASVYRRPAPVSADDLRLMELIDRQYLARPFYGSRRMAAWLATQGHPVNRKRVQRLMRLMGLVAIYQRPNTSKAAPEHTKYPVPAGRPDDRPGQPGLVQRHYLHPAGQGLHLPGGDHGLALAGGAGLADFEHAACRLLRRCPGRGAAAVRQAGDLQHRSGQPIHQHRLHRRAEGPRHQDQHGRQGPVHGQHLRRAALEKLEI